MQEKAKLDFFRLFNEGGELKFSKGLKEYEEMYELCKEDLDKFGYERIEEKEIGYTLVIIKKRI